MSRRLLLILLFSAACAHAQSTETLAPDAIDTVASWSGAATDADEDIDGTLDGNTLGTPNNPDSPTNDIVISMDGLLDAGGSCPSDISEITAANVRISAIKNNNNRTLSLAVSWNADAATDFNTGDIALTQTEYNSGNQTVSVTLAECQAGTVTLAPTTGGGTGAPTTVDVETVNIDITYTPTVGGGAKTLTLLGVGQ